MSVRSPDALGAENLSPYYHNKEVLVINDIICIKNNILALETHTSISVQGISSADHFFVKSKCPQDFHLIIYWSAKLPKNYRDLQKKNYAAWVLSWLLGWLKSPPADLGLLSGLLSDPGNLSPSPLPGPAAIRKPLLSPGGSAHQPGRATCSEASCAFCMGDRAC